MRTSRSRRELLGTLAATCAGALVDPGPVLARLAAQQPCAVPGAAGTLLGTLPLFRSDAEIQPFGVKFGGRGLDARLVTDLSLLQPEDLITPTHLAYIRTEYPPRAASRTGPWTITASGLAAGATAVSAEELTRDARAMGPHLLECAGNNNPANFGLMSVAEWHGVALTEIVARLRPGPTAAGVLVGGVDPDRSVSSVSGASWVVPLDALDRLGAFLAVSMNGEPLPADHGRPVRLVVPGWYGCAWIKWVDTIRLVGRDEPATSQMQEFAGRTHQSKRHDLARDFAPPAIQTAATPIRVEKRRGDAGLEYRIVGIVWGGTTPVDRLQIRFSPQDPWVAFRVCPAARAPAVWSLWAYQWKPPAAGVYSIALRADDPSLPQRRLAMGYYTRQVRVDEI